MLPLVVQVLTPALSKEDSGTVAFLPYFHINGCFTCTPCALVSQGCQKYPLELQLQRVVSHPGPAENQTPVLGKSRVEIIKIENLGEEQAFFLDHSHAS